MTKKEIYRAYYQSPLGWIEIRSNGNEITGVEFTSKKRQRRDHHASLNPAVRQLDKYFKGTGTRFSLKLNFTGTPFQRAVWRRLQRIKFASVDSYQELARRLGRKKAARAVGSAIGRNKFIIVVPCHRVIASNGGIAGYAGGVWRKKWLLDHESGLIKRR